MAKLNKQEKQYAVQRIMKEIDTIVDEKLGPYPTLLCDIDAIKEAASNGTLKLKSQKEVMKVARNSLMGHRFSNRVDVIDIVELPSEYKKRETEAEKLIEKRKELQAKLTKKAQPIIDEINLGQADAARIAEVVKQLRK